jgi:glycosyltransferase involved in cell wall biosynthesis
MKQAVRPAAALIIPALNEEAVLAKTLERIPPGLFALIIVADNGSTDRTAEVARAHGALVSFEPRRGYGAACLRALGDIPRPDLPPYIEAIVFMQADLSEEPAEAERLLAPLFEGRADLVIGSRTLGRAEAGALLAHQVWGNRLLISMIRWLFGHRFTDLGPFRAIRADALRELGMQDRDYGWTVEMQVRALRRNLRILEVPVTYRIRAAGENKVSGRLGASLMAGVKMIFVVLRLALRRP